MELATKRSHAGAKADLRALVNGQYAGDEHALIEKVAADLLAGVSARAGGKPGAGKIAGLSSEAARRASGRAPRSGWNAPVSTPL